MYFSTLGVQAYIHLDKSVLQTSVFLSSSLDKYIFHQIITFAVFGSYLIKCHDTVLICESGFINSKFTFTVITDDQNNEMIAWKWMQDFMVCISCIWTTGIHDYLSKYFSHVTLMKTHYVQTYLIFRWNYIQFDSPVITL